METLRAAYEIAKQNDGAPGVDGVTFEAIEAQGVELCSSSYGTN
jgi:RNA-directed DNA polymerase